MPGRRKKTTLRKRRPAKIGIGRPKKGNVTEIHAESEFRERRRELDTHWRTETPEGVAFAAIEHFVPAKRRKKQSVIGQLNRASLAAVNTANAMRILLISGNLSVQHPTKKKKVMALTHGLSQIFVEISQRKGGMPEAEVKRKRMGRSMSDLVRYGLVRRVWEAREIRTTVKNYKGDETVRIKHVGQWVYRVNPEAKETVDRYLHYRRFVEDFIQKWLKPLRVSITYDQAEAFLKGVMPLLPPL